MKDVIVIGSGPAGLTAGIYTARANLNPIVFEGTQPGGQLTITTDVENYPGFPEGVMGPELMENMRKQAQRFGADCRMEAVDKVDLSQKPYKVQVGDEVYETKTVIIATGASARLLGMESESKLMGFGVSACATCDGFFYRGKEVMVVGGGDSALEEAIYLTRFATKVYLVHRRDEFRGSKIMRDRALKHPQIEVLWNSVIDEFIGEQSSGGLTSVRLKDTKTGETREQNIDGVFIAIGHEPNTKLFKDYIELHDNGFIKTMDGTSKTNLEGVYAAGDVQDFVYKQAISAAGSGCMAALDAERYLESLEG